MYDELLSTIEKGVLSSSGSIPVILNGIEHNLEKKADAPVTSRHTSHELFYVRNGKVELTIGDKTTVVEKGSTVIIRPNTLHGVRVSSGTADLFALYFGFAGDEETVKRMLESSADYKNSSVPSMAQTSIESFLEFAGGTDLDELKKNSYFIISGTYKKAISNIVERIVDEMKEELYSGQVMMQILTIELMITLCRAMKKEWEESLQVKNGKAGELVLIAKNYMDEHYDAGITIASVASYVFLSQGYFTRAFRDEFGMSPMSYLMKIRIEKACELLKDDEVKVSWVATQSGFSSAQRFNTAFRKNVGMTPMEYRRKFKNKDGE